jgi:phosphatidylglycerophosphate synthase
LTFLLAAPERRLLRAIAARLPRWVMPDHLTALGIAGALGVGAGYALTLFHPGWLWLASAMLVVNWFGDSLDGTTARVRQIERPKYGYYLDHAVDGINTLAVGVGIGISPYVPLEVALLLVIAYLCLSINLYLEAQVVGVFDMGYGIFGPTEVRLLLILANTGLWAGETVAGLAAAHVERVATWVFLGVTAGMFYAFARRFSINLRRLARLEPPGRRR